MSVKYEVTEINQEQCPQELDEAVKEESQKGARLLVIEKHILTTDGLKTNVWYNAYMERETLYKILSPQDETIRKHYMSISDICKFIKHGGNQLRAAVKNALDESEFLQGGEENGKSI